MGSYYGALSCAFGCNIVFLRFFVAYLVCLQSPIDGRLLHDMALGVVGQGARLRPDEWKSAPAGEERLWLVELCAPFATEENKLTQAMVADLMQNVFVGKKFKMHVTDPLTGKREVKEIGV